MNQEQKKKFFTEYFYNVESEFIEVLERVNKLDSVNCNACDSSPESQASLEELFNLKSKLIFALYGVREIFLVLNVESTNFDVFRAGYLEDHEWRTFLPNQLGSVVSRMVDFWLPLLKQDLDVSLSGGATIHEIAESK
ncbi:hypothetical protein [Vibrio astriarenae]|uniref:hypothetical protein n=1 Tax=Vibrio astriarenae TaxID=1481923 RepID=UPI003736F6EE